MQTGKCGPYHRPWWTWRASSSWGAGRSSGSRWPLQEHRALSEHAKLNMSKHNVLQSYTLFLEARIKIREIIIVFTVWLYRLQWIYLDTCCTVVTSLSGMRGSQVQRQIVISVIQELVLTLLLMNVPTPLTQSYSSHSTYTTTYSIWVWYTVTEETNHVSIKAQTRFLHSVHQMNWMFSNYYSQHPRKHL